MSHLYELPIHPTTVQEEQLLQQAELLNLLRAAARASTDPLPQVISAAPGLLNLPKSLLEHTVWLEHCLLEHEQVRGIPAIPAINRQPALVGPGLLRQFVAGHLDLVGVSGPVRSEVALLPPWAQVVCLREVGEDRLFAELMRDVPELVQAQREDWVDVRREAYGWVAEVSFSWAAYPAGSLMRRWEDTQEELTGDRGSQKVARLMGWDG